MIRAILQAWFSFVCWKRGKHAFRVTFIQPEAAAMVCRCGRRRYEWIERRARGF